jgi:2-(3-amino-3-carboxypropyl)histidine synthase
MFVEARKIIKAEDKEQIEKAVKKFVKKFPKIKKICLIASVQYIDFLKEFKRCLNKNAKKVFIGKGGLTIYPGQIIGCDVSAGKKFEKRVDAFLLLGSGRFHALQLALCTKKPIFTWHCNGVCQIDEQEVEKLMNRRKAAVTKFLAAKEIGIIVSIKSGQTRLKEAIMLKNKLEKAGKEAFLFIADTIDIDELENFSCQAWLNTACPAMVFDSTKLVNWQEVKKFLKE